MSLRNKISLIISLLFTIIFGISASVIYFLFDDFRTEEFESRLNEKAMSSIKLLVEVEQIDRQLLKIIDQNDINKLYEEKTLIFDQDYNLIYSSLDDTEVKWTLDDLKFLKKNKSFFKRDKEQEIYGVFYDTNNKDFYALVSAKDNYGKRKLEYLLVILIITYIIFTIICWVITYFLIARLLTPIHVFLNKIKGINENNLDTRIAVKDQKDEIDLLANEFNQMLERIDVSYKKQKEFTANASHEFRTPIARISVQLENKIIAAKLEGTTTKFYESLLEEINQLSELISSLLLLSKLDLETNKYLEECRVDELIFEALENINKIYPDFKLDLDILNVETLDVKGNKSLLIIAFNNLFKNAYLYSQNKQASVKIESNEKELKVWISNNGPSLSDEEQSTLFQPFMRGQNAKSKSGLGIGLRIIQRILIQHNASIFYFSNTQTSNNFLLTFEL
jgi:two-component system, OmpR family, sensor histidine kinase ArlS